MVTPRRAFTLFRDGCVTLDIAASSTLTWRIPHQIPSTDELDIELSQKLSAIALSDVQAGGPLKPGFCLSGGVLQLDRNLPAALSCFFVVYFYSISSRSPLPGELPTAGAS